MIYLIFWLCLMALQLPYYYLSFILGFTVLLCPRGHRRFLLYTLVLALTVANVQSIWRHYNAIDLGESVGGYVYRIASNKADIYIDGRKYRLKAKGLTDELEGRCIVIKAVTLQRQKTLNRHSYNYQRHYQLLGYSGYIKGRVARAIKAPPDSIVRRSAHWLRGYLLDYGETLPKNAATLYRALLLGEMQDDALTKRVVALGIIHLFVVSGFHFAAISAILFFILFNVFRFPYRLANGVVLALSALYLTIVKLGFGSVRALLTIALVYACFYLRRKVDTVQLTFIFVCAALLYNVHVVYDLGFQLTTLSVLAVVTINRLLSRYRFIAQTLRLFISAVAVLFCVAGALLYSNGSVPLIGVLVMPLLSPLVGIFIILSLFGLLSSIFFTIPYFDVMLGALADLIYDFISWASALSPIELNIAPQIGLAFIIVLLAAFIGHVLTNRGWRWQRGAAIGFLVAGIILLSEVQGGLTIAGYALYDGEAYLIRAPGAVVIYDVGNSPEIIHMLRREGVVAIDAIIISHPHRDHDGMLDEICRQFKVSKVIREIDGETELDIGSLHLKLLRAPLGISDNVNDQSIICHLQYGAFDMLFNGDMEEAETSWLLKNYDCDVDVLKVPHHGSYNAEFAKMLDAYQPEAAIIAGGNGKRIDKSKIINILNDTNTPFYDTMSEGEILIRATAATYQIEAIGEKHVIQGFLQ